MSEREVHLFARYTKECGCIGVHRQDGVWASIWEPIREDSLRGRERRWFQELVSSW